MSDWFEKIRRGGFLAKQADIMWIHLTNPPERLVSFSPPRMIRSDGSGEVVHTNNGSNVFIIFAFIFRLNNQQFLNVVVYRHNTGLTLRWESFRLYCGKELNWYQMLPIMSFLCFRTLRHVQVQIVAQYPLVELATALFFTIIYIYKRRGIYIGTELLFYTLYMWFMGSLLIVIAAYDIRHKIIPDGIAYIFILASILRPIFLSRKGTDEEILWSLAGPALTLPFATPFLLSGGETYGFWRCQANPWAWVGSWESLSRAFRSC